MYLIIIAEYNKYKIGTYNIPCMFDLNCKYIKSYNMRFIFIIYCMADNQ